MLNYSNVVIIGNVTADPQQVEAGKGVVNKFSVAVNKSFKDKKGEWQKKTDFVPVEFWGEFFVEISKGDLVLVDGTLQSNHWETEEGKKRSSLSVRASAVKKFNLQDNKQENKEDKEDLKTKKSSKVRQAEQVPF